MNSDLKIVVVGGGTGSFTVLSALRGHNRELTAIVSMADDGGSTGVLRDELGVLPPGDIRQCLVALSSSPAMRELFDYRYEEGPFKGHSFGNMFLTTLEKTTGDFAKAVESASEILRIKGTVIPATLDDVRLLMRWENEQVELHGERVIDVDNFQLDPRQAELSLKPTPQVNPSAIEAIMEADLVVVSPGDLYTSLGPLLIIDGIGQALRQSNAKVLYVCNLTTKHGQTDGFSVEDHVREIERFAGGEVIDSVLYNTERPPADLEERYLAEKAFVLERDDSDDRSHVSYIGKDLLGMMADKSNSQADQLAMNRSLIRHDKDKLGLAIINYGAGDSQ